METLYELQDWVKLVREEASSLVPIVLVGSKFDMISPDNVPSLCQEAEKFASDMHLTQFITISSKSGANVDETMDYMIDLLLWQKDQGIISESISQKVPSKQDPIQRDEGPLPRSGSKDLNLDPIMDKNLDPNKDTPFLGK